METEGGIPTHRPRSSKASGSSVLPEVDVFIHLLVLLRLLDSDCMEKVMWCTSDALYCYTGVIVVLQNTLFICNSFVRQGSAVFV